MTHFIKNAIRIVFKLLSQFYFTCLTTEKMPRVPQRVLQSREARKKSLDKQLQENSRDSRDKGGMFFVLGPFCDIFRLQVK